MMKGVDRNAPVVLDMEDKITALAEEDNMDNRVALILRTINSLIGETSKQKFAPIYGDIYSKLF